MLKKLIKIFLIMNLILAVAMPVTGCGNKPIVYDLYVVVYDEDGKEIARSNEAEGDSTIFSLGDTPIEFPADVKDQQFPYTCKFFVKSPGGEALLEPDEKLLNEDDYIIGFYYYTYNDINQEWDPFGLPWLKKGEVLKYKLEIWVKQLKDKSHYDGFKEICEDVYLCLYFSYKGV